MKNKKTAIEVFNRREVKFIIDRDTYEKLVVDLENYLELDEYNNIEDFYGVYNIYFDTDNDLLIRNSIKGPQFKQKLRMRAYGDVTEDSLVFIEIKKKVCGIVNKRRTFARLSDANLYFEQHVPLPVRPYVNKQVMCEIDAFVNSYSTLKPKVFIAYDRRAYFGADDSNLRVTFDTNIRTRRNDLRLDMGTYGKLLLPEDSILMEIKIQDSFPLWVARLLSKHLCFKSSFSKYGTEYQQNLINHVGGREKCKISSTY